MRAKTPENHVKTSRPTYKRYGYSQHPGTELACGFRSRHGRWPVWWEMAKMMQDGKVLE